MPECRQKVTLASAFWPAVSCVSSPSAFWDQGQSGTAGVGLVRNCPALDCNYQSGVWVSFLEIEINLKHYFSSKLILKCKEISTLSPPFKTKIVILSIFSGLETLDMPVRKKTWPADTRPGPDSCVTCSPILSNQSCRYSLDSQSKLRILRRRSRSHKFYLIGSAGTADKAMWQIILLGRCTFDNFLFLICWKHIEELCPQFCHEIFVFQGQNWLF